jgi:hypothetical protein
LGGGWSSSSRSATSALRLETVLIALLKDGSETLLSRACHLDDGCRLFVSVSSDLRLGTVLTALPKDGGETMLSKACHLDDGSRLSGSVPPDLRLAALLYARAVEGAVSGATVLERGPDLL